MNTETSTALALLIRSAEEMSAEAAKAQAKNSARYGAKFDRAAAFYRSSCFALQADARDLWDYITAEGVINTERARVLLSSH